MTEKILIIESKINGTFEVLLDESIWKELNEKYENLVVYVNKDHARKSKSGKITKWSLKHRARVLYGPYGHTPSKRKESSLHTLIMNTPKGMVVDHINGNPLDNRKCNLRICTNAENSRNNTLWKTSSIGLKGVQSAKANGSAKSYRARIKYNYEEIQLGTFITKEEAGIAYDKKALELFGEFASLNYPDGPSKSLLEHIKEENLKWEEARPVRKRPYRGVCRNSSIVGRWGARINIDTLTKQLGTFDSPEEAALVYDTKAIEIFGSNAHLNFPDGPSQEILELIETGKKKAAQYQKPPNKRRKPTARASGYFGVQKVTNSKTWSAQFQYNKKRIYLGCYKTKEEAARVYDKKAIEMLGSFATLNFPKEHNV